MNHSFRRLAIAMLALLAAPALASFHTWKIEQLYSNADGTLQFIVLHESLGADGESELTGQALTSTHGGVAKRYLFNHDLPGGGGYYGGSSQTANKRLVIATVGVAQLGLAPDYVIPDRFLATDGGVLDYAGVDQFTYAPLPTDGVNALLRSGTLVVNTAVNFNGTSATIPTRPITAVEFYNPGLDHYFVSALAPDIDALESGRLAGWSATGKSFRVFATQADGGVGVNPVCRFYIPPPFGDSHFFSASPDECAATRTKFAQFSYESPNVFYVALPDTATGACPAGTTPVYRVWNQRADSNHRYTTDRALRDQMLANGYLAEGYGPDQVIMCAA